MSESNEIQACIFDLDGVIVDTARYHYKAWKRLANELGFDLTPEQNEKMKGISRIESLEMLLEMGNKQATRKEKKQLADIKNSWYKEYITEMQPDDLLPGVVDFLEELTEEHILVAIGSASRNAPAIIRQVQIGRYLDALIDGSKVKKGKPDPEVFLKAAEEMGMPPEHCVVFEDARAGIEAAKNGGMRAIGVGSPSVLNQADMVISGISEMNLEKLKSLE
ncbi:MAG TPA: beta-phosphoglucomutase [Bacteroidales bacterium]|nr:beta-phosphoglucomutase [Bacteroidales bacterium]